MDISPQVLEMLTYVEKIFRQGELDEFIDLVQTPNRIMLVLAMKGKTKPSELSEILNISRPNVTANLRVLEEKGFLTRMINSSNRREVFVTLTKDGMDHFENVIKKITSLFHVWFDLLGEEETQHVLNILRISSDEKVALEYKKRK